MMEYLMAHAPARRVNIARPRQSAHHFSGDVFVEDLVGEGLRSGDDYIPCYPMKKSRSHTTMAPFRGSVVLEADAAGYTITSAPDNAYFAHDQDGDSGDADDADADAGSACCDKGGGSAETSCCCPHTGTAPLQLRHSGSLSSTTGGLSSATPSGISSPSPTALLSSCPGLGCTCSGVSSADADAAALGSLAVLAGGGGAAVPPSHHHQHYSHCLPAGSQPMGGAAEEPIFGAAATAAAASAMASAAPAPAGAVAAAAPSDAGEPTAAAEVDGEGGSDLMGAFGSLTTDQWDVFQAAVSGREPGTAAEGAAHAVCPARSASGGGGVVSVPAGPAPLMHMPASRLLSELDEQPLEQQQGDRQRDRQQDRQHMNVRSSAATIDWPDSVAVTQPPPSGAFAFGAGNYGGAATAAAGGTDGCGVAGGSSGAGGSDGADRASPGGSSTSIASLWAAVNSVAAGAAVYDSTDDSAQAVQMFRRHGLCGGGGHYYQQQQQRSVLGAVAAPSVPPPLKAAYGAPEAAAADAFHSLSSRPQAPDHHHPHTNNIKSSSNYQPSYNDLNHQHHQLEALLAARHSHNAGCTAVRLPAQTMQTDGAGGAASLLIAPGSPAAARSMSCSAAAAAADGGKSSSLFVAARNQLLLERYGQEPHQERRGSGAGAGAGGSSSAHTTIDGMYRYNFGDECCGGGGGGGYSRAAAQARSNAHSRYSVDLSHYRPRHPQQQQQHQVIPYHQQAVQQSYSQYHHRQQQQLFHQQAEAAVAAAAVTAAAAGSYSHNPSFGSSRSRGGLALPPQPTSYTTYGYRRARSSLAALDQLNAVGGAAAAGSGSDDDDDTEEATRRITAAFRTHHGMSRNSGWALLETDSAPTTPAVAAARRDHWAAIGAAAAAANNGATVVGGGAAGASAAGISGGNGHNGGGGGRVANGENGSGEAAGGGGWKRAALLDAAGSGVPGGGGGGCEGSAEEHGAEGEVATGATGCLLARRRSSYHLTNSHAAVELFLRLNHARQTMDFVKRQTELFARLDKAQLSVWEALTSLNELREYEAVLMAEGGEAQEVSELSLLEHAFQTAELCRLHHPDLDWLHLVGLMHGLGKLLAHRRFGSQPQWAVCGETFPLGCRFSPHILGSQYFTANPDRRRRLYNTPTGLYGPGCGLLNVVMSWSAPEYLYLVLVLNAAPLPQDALWVLRHAKFAALTRPHSCYLPLCGGDDLRRLPLLRSFQSLAAYRRVPLPPGFELTGSQRSAYYSGLIAKYVGEGRLNW